MPNVVRFALSTAKTLYVPGAGTFVAGILDVDANNLAYLARVRWLVQPYRAVELGTVDAATPKPSLPAVPGPPAPDPYPQYLTPAEAASSPELRAAFGSPPADSLSRLAAATTRCASVQLVPFPEGASVTIAEIDGPGTVSAVWFALDQPVDPGPLYDSRLRVYYDGSSTPAIDVDLGSLAAVHWSWSAGLEASYGCAHVKVEAKLPAPGPYWMGLSLQYPIPFGSHVKVELYNPAPFQGTLFGQVFYTLGPTSPLRLHSAGQRAFEVTTDTAAGASPEILNLSGAGWLVFNSISGGGVDNDTWLERDVEVTVNGEATPSLRTSGLEDWFHGAHYFMDRQGVSHRVMMVGTRSGKYASAAADLLELYGGIRFDNGIRIRLVSEAAVTTAVTLSHCWLYYV